MGLYRTILIVVTVLSFLSVAGMQEIRIPLVLAITCINVFGWSWPFIDKWIKRRNRLTHEGEQELKVGNYSEAEKSLKLAAAENRGAGPAKRASILRNLAECQRKQSN